MEKEKEGFPITSLREINTLLKAQHPNIVTVRVSNIGRNFNKATFKCILNIFIYYDYYYFGKRDGNSRRRFFFNILI